MDNPFLRRVTEFFRDDEAFLAIVSPEPLVHFLVPHGKAGALYDPLVLMRGTPGSGKTTMARLFELPTLAALLRNSSIQSYAQLVRALTDCGALQDGLPNVLGCRLPLETDYRDFWEFPYPDELKVSLMTTLIQARAILGWSRHLRHVGVDLAKVAIVPRDGSEAALEAIGGSGAPGLVERARLVERSLYRTVGALVAPPIEHLDREVTEAYKPFDVIERVTFEFSLTDEPRSICAQPLVILDDAHTLHPAQFHGLEQWLQRRELRVARWVLTRLDVMHTQEALTALTAERSGPPPLPGVTSDRTTTEILLQSNPAERRQSRTAFRKMARDMARRYLRQMPLFQSRGLDRLSDLLQTDELQITSRQRTELQTSVDATCRQFGVTESRLSKLKDELDGYRTDLPEDIKLAMLRILLHRYIGRTAQRSMFDDDVDAPRPVLPDRSVYDGAQLHLLHEFNRPYFFGIDDVCDAGSENAEQFLHLAAELVNASATQLIRGRPPSLDAGVQSRVLRKLASDVISKWDFPEYPAVRALVDYIGERCLSVSKQPNAPLGYGANAYGILQPEFDQIADRHPELARVLQYGVAYNAFTLVPRYSQGVRGREWCLLELGGFPILHYGLTLKRGGFVEGSSNELAGVLKAIP